MPRGYGHRARAQISLQTPVRTTSPFTIMNFPPILSGKLRLVNRRDRSSFWVLLTLARRTRLFRNIQFGLSIQISFVCPSWGSSGIGIYFILRLYPVIPPWIIFARLFRCVGVNFEYVGVSLLIFHISRYHMFGFWWSLQKFRNNRRPVSLVYWFYRSLAFIIWLVKYVIWTIPDMCITNLCCQGLRARRNGCELQVANTGHESVAL